MLQNQNENEQQQEKKWIIICRGVWKPISLIIHERLSLKMK